MNRLLSTLVALALVGSGCAASASPTPSGGTEIAQANLARAGTTQADATSAASALNAFAADLYRRGAATGRDLVLSPASVAIALSMARAGAKGETAAQMDAVLRGLGSDASAAAINALDAALNSRSGTFKDQEGKSLDVSLRIANASFAQRDLVFVEAFLDALATRYGAGVRLVDYKADPEAARAAINGWVAGQTEQRIKELLKPGILTPATRLTLVNAIYLKAPWQEPFIDGATTAAPFTRPDGSTVQAQLMRHLGSLPYAEGSGWRAVQIPYIGGSLALTVIVPDDLAAFDRSLTGETISTVTAALQPRPVDLFFPKLSLETSTGLSDLLAALGMPLAFDPDRADFSGITTAEQLFISAVIHQANIDVDEKGTEAAAATAVVMDTAAAPAEPVVMRVDRPFVFLLRDVPTGAVVFMGRVTDPTARG